MVLAGGFCQVVLKTNIRVPITFTVAACNIRGNLQKIGPHFIGTFIVDVSELASGINRMDFFLHHTYLNSRKHKYASMKLDPVTIGDKEFTGLLRLNGRKRMVKGQIFESNLSFLDGSFSISLPEFGVPVPSYKGLRFDENIAIKFRVK